MSGAPFWAGLREGLFSDPEPLPDREIVPVAEQVIVASATHMATEPS